MLDISLITIDTCHRKSWIIIEPKNNHREVLKLRCWLDNPREVAVTKLRGEIEADVLGLPLQD